MKKKYFIPHNLEVNTLISDNYPKFKPFKKENLLYILSLLNDIRLSNTINKKIS